MPDPRDAVRTAARELLAALAGCQTPMRVTEVVGDLACLIQVWNPSRVMPTVNGERRQRNRRAGCREDILGLVRTANRPLTRKELVRALRDTSKPHGAGTVAKALAELTRDGELINPKDKRGYRLPEWWRPRPQTPSLFPNRP